MATTLILDGVDLNGWTNNTAGNHYAANGTVDFGGRALSDALLTGDLQPSEYDQYLSQARFTRVVTIPIRLRSGSVAGVAADVSRIQQKLDQASRATPIDFVVTPHRSTRTSTFKVIGGDVDFSYTSVTEVLGEQDIVVTLNALPWCYGAAQLIGNASAPLAANQSAPVTATVTPASGVEGDVPADVSVYLKSRSTTGNNIRSVLIAAKSGDTAWTGWTPASSWTNQNSATKPSSSGLGGVSSTLLRSPQALTANQIVAIAQWPYPATAPKDTPTRFYLRVRDNTTSSRGQQMYRLRVVYGANEQVGDWRSVPEQAAATTWQASDMGLFYVPSSVAAASVVVVLDHASLVTVTGSAGLYYDLVEYLPDSSYVTYETIDTSKTLLASGETVVFDESTVTLSDGTIRGGIVVGSDFRFRGATRIFIHESVGYMAALDDPGWSVALRPVDVWASYTPRYFHLAG